MSPSATARATGVVVDDDPQVRAFLARTLRGNGMRVLEADSGVTALTLIGTTVPDFVVTDLQMRDMDGWELCRTLRGSPATRKVIIVVVSGTPADAATIAGCDVVLAKPCRPDRLLAAIQKLLDERA